MLLCRPANPVSVVSMNPDLSSQLAFSEASCSGLEYQGIQLINRYRTVFWASRNLLSKIFSEEHCWREAPNTHLPISNTPLAPANQTLNRSRSCNHLYDSKMGHKEARFLSAQLLWKEAKARNGWRVKNRSFKRELCVARDVLTGIRFLSSRIQPTHSMKSYGSLNHKTLLLQCDDHLSDLLLIRMWHMRHLLLEKETRPSQHAGIDHRL